MNIEERKTVLLQLLEEIEKDIEQLKVGIEICKNDIPAVVSEEDARIFDETHNLESGLKHIQLF